MATLKGIIRYLKDKLPFFREEDNDCFVNGKYFGLGTTTEAPSDTAANAVAGATILDKTNNIVYISNGTAFRNILMGKLGLSLAATTAHTPTSGTSSYGYGDSWFVIDTDRILIHNGTEWKYVALS